MHEYQAIVGSSRVGADGRLTIGAAVDYMQDCEWFDIVGERSASAYFEEKGVGMFVVSRQLDLLRMPLFSEKITVRTWAYDCTRLLGFRNTLICDGAGEVCVASYSIGSFVEKEKGRSARVPQAIADSIFKDAKYPMEYLPRKITVPEEAGELFPPERVCKYHIDNNRHMNNARYLEIAEDCLPEEFLFNQLRVEYRTPAKRGDRITPRMFCGEGKSAGGRERTRIVSLCDQDGRLNAVVEFGRMNGHRETAMAGRMNREKER